MNRLGWGCLLLILLGIGGFVLMLGGEADDADKAPAADVAVVTPVTITPSGLAIPVAGIEAAVLYDSFGDERSGGDRTHHAIDIVAPRGTPVVAAMGTVGGCESEGGGTTAYVRSNDGRWIAYYAHLDAYAPGLAEDARLRRGDPIGTVGDSGNAEPGNTHLHFALNRMAPGEAWHEGTPINPYPLLAGQGASR